MDSNQVNIAERMSCIPLLHIALRRKKTSKEFCQQKQERSGSLSRRKTKEIIENLPKENLMDRVNNWLENYENELENFAYMERSNETFDETDDDFDERIKSKNLNLKAINPKKLLGNYLRGCFIHKLDPTKCSVTNHSMTMQKN